MDPLTLFLTGGVSILNTVLGQPTAQANAAAAQAQADAAKTNAETAILLKQQEAQNLKTMMTYGLIAIGLIGAGFVVVQLVK